MGSGASTEVISLVETVRSDKGGKRLDAIKKLIEKSKVVEYKGPLSSPELGLLKELALVIKEDKGEARRSSFTCLINISQDGTAKVNMSDPSVGVIEASVQTAREAINGTTIINEDILESAVIVPSNCANTDGTAKHLYSASTNLASLAKQLLMTTSARFIRLGIKLLTNSFGFPSSAFLVPSFLAEKIPDTVMDVLNRAMKDSSAWGSDSYGSWSITFFRNFCFHRDAALYVKNMPNFLSLLQSVEQKMPSRFYKIVYFFVMTLICGRDEVVSGAKQSVLQSNQSILKDILAVFSNAVTGQKADDYSYDMFKIPLLINAIRVLAVSDNNKKVMVTNPDLLSLLITVLKRFANNEEAFSGKTNFGTVLSIGGGGEDVTSAEMAVETLCQLSYTFDRDEDLINNFLKPDKEISQLITKLLDTKKLSDDSKGQLMSLDRRVNPNKKVAVTIAATPVQKSAPADTAHNDDNNTQPSKHIMISYSWKVGKPLVESLQKSLQSLGLDVWRDETGSKLVSPMQGDVVEKMAEAIEASHTIIVCISRWYKESPNCRAEANYIRQRQPIQNLKIIFLMMENDYTTVSPHPVDGWLGFFVGTELWYPLFQPSNVDGTAGEIAKLISIKGSNPIKAISPIPQASTTTTTGNSNEGVADYNLAWTLIQDTSKADEQAGLSEFLSSLGVSSGEDLSELTKEEFVTISKFFKPVQQRKLNKALLI